MSPQQVEKLKGLIASSEILSYVEKQEWDALLELMNDKQMLELEKILLEGVKKPAVLPAQPLVQKEAVKKEPKVLPVTPALGHILNIPKAGGSEFTPLAAPVSQHPQDTALNKPSSFLQKLKALIKEPELPSGKEEKLLPQAGQTSQEILVEPFKLKEQPKVVLSPLKVPLPPKPPIKSTKPVEKIQTSEIQKNEEDKKGIKAWPSRFEVNKKLQPATVLAKPGNAQSLSESVQPKGSEQLQKNSASVASKSFNAEKPIFTKTTVMPAKLDEPKDLESFDFDHLSDQTVNVIKNLSKKFGYYEIIFHLEKSPLYKSYIETGTHLLETSTTLEEGTKAGGGLNKDKFERIADMLREIQAE